MSLLKDFAEASNAWINVLIKLAIAAIVAMILFFPHYMPILRRVVVKSSEFNLEGVKFQVIDTALTGKGVDITDDGRLTIGGVDVSDFPDQNAQLRQQIGDLNGQIATLNDTIQQQQQLLAQANHDLEHAKTSAAAPGPAETDHGAPNHPVPSASPVPAAPAAESKLASLIQESAKAAVQQRTAADAAVKSASELVQQSAPPSGVGFGIVFGADASPEAAMDEVRKITQPPVSADRVLLYKRQGSWRSVAYYDTRDAANGQFAAIKKIKPQSYLVNISAWCPAPVVLSRPQPPDKVEQKDCQF